MKKRINKRFASVLLAVMMIISSFSMSALNAVAETASEEVFSLYVAGVGMKAGDYLEVGASEVQREKPQNGGYAYYNGGSLELVDFSYTGGGYFAKEEIDKYLTYTYPTVIFSEKALTILVTGENSLIAKDNTGSTRGIYSRESITLNGSGKLYVKAQRPVFADENVFVNNVYLDVYSDYFYSIYSYQGSIITSFATLRVRGAAGLFTYANGQKVKFYQSAVDVSVDDTGIFTQGEVEIDDSYVKLISKNKSSAAIYSSGNEIKFISVEGKGAFNTTGSNAVAFDKSESAGYYWVEVSRTKKLSYIDIIDISIPESFAYPDFKGKADSPYTEILSVEWFELDGDTIVKTLTEDDYFEKNGKYRLRVTVKAGYSYEYNDINTTAYIGDSQVNNYCKDINLKVRVLEKDYIATSNPENRTLTIGNVMLKNGDYLIKGDSKVTTSQPADNYAYYNDGILVLHNFVDKYADIVFAEGYLSVRLEGYNKISSISDTFETDEEIHEVIFYGDGELDIVGSLSSSSRTSGVNLSGFLFVSEATVNIDADITYCIDAKGVWVSSGELYCYTAQGGVFAGKTEIKVRGGMFHAFDGGCWAEFINEQVFVSTGVVYVSNDGRNEMETAVEWDGKTPLTTYEAVWVVANKIDEDPDDPETDVTEPEYLLGDVTGDGCVDSTDYLRIKGHFLGTYHIEGTAFKAGDVTKDGIIDSTDYLRIKGHFLGTYNLHG